jgi:hypothetical protein
VSDQRKRYCRSDCTHFNGREVDSLFVFHKSSAAGWPRWHSNQFEFAGVDVDIRKANWPVSVAAQLLAAAGGGFISAGANLGKLVRMRSIRVPDQSLGSASVSNLATGSRGRLAFRVLSSVVRLPQGK